MGDFEYALMFYHRGHKIRPELHEFTLGIQKAEEAINNSIGCKKTILVSTELVINFCCYHIVTDAILQYEVHEEN